MNKYLRGALLILLYQGPVLLLFFNVIDYRFRYVLLFTFTFILFGYTYLRKYSLRDLGFRIDNFRKDILINSIFSLIIAQALIISYKLGCKESTFCWNSFSFSMFLSVISEFLFRSCFHELKF